LKVKLSHLNHLSHCSGASARSRYALGNRKVSYHSDRRRGEAIKRGPLYIPRAKAKYYLDYSSIRKSARLARTSCGSQEDGPSHDALLSYLIELDLDPQPRLHRCVRLPNIERPSDPRRVLKPLLDHTHLRLVRSAPN
jgi:hypothetical protein